MQKRISVRTVVIVAIAAMLITLPFFSACGTEEEKEPSPEPTQAKPVVKEHEPVELTIYTTQFGSGGYVVSFGLSEIINKNHPWIRAKVVETLGSLDIINTMRRLDQESQKRAVGYTSTLFGGMLQKGTPPLTEPGEMLSGVFRWFLPGETFATLDPNIKTGQDLIGKRVSSGTLAAFGMAPEAVLEAWGVKDKVKLSHAGQNDAKDQLIDGLIDVGTFTWIQVGNKFMGSPALKEVLTRKNAHLISISKDMLEKARGIEPSMFYWEAPVEAFGPWQTEPLGLIGGVNYLGAFPELDPELAYEIVKIAKEHGSEFKEYHALGGELADPNNLAKFPDSVRVHSGAARYYQEQGIKIGLD